MPVPIAAAGGSRRAIRELIEVVLLAALLYGAMQVVVQPVKVNGYSMQSTLSDQDYLVATRIDYRLHPPRRGDIVILDGTSDPDLAPLSVERFRGRFEEPAQLQAACVERYARKYTK